jgi:hypothetical protein
MIKHDSITAMTSYTACTRYNWRHEQPKGDLEIHLGKWVVDTEGRLLKVVAKAPREWVLLGQGQTVPIIVRYAGLQSNYCGSQCWLSIPAPRCSRMHKLKTKILSHPNWNWTVQKLWKENPTWEWTAALYCGRGSLRKPTEILCNDK